MSWTIEKIRELPEPNIFGITRAGEHFWKIGHSTSIMYTGDGGVVEYCQQFEKTINETIDNDDLTHASFEIILATVTARKNGMDKSK